MSLLKFSHGNAKLANRLIFNLPAGYTCPSAGVCKTFANRQTGKINDSLALSSAGVNTYRCFAAMAETRPTVRDARWYNWELLKDIMYANDDYIEGMTELIINSLAPYKENLIRIHESGDFWTELYMMAWISVARQEPNRTFYAYTKSLNMWLNLASEIPANLFLTASIGGQLDSLIPGRESIFIRRAYVVYTEEEAVMRGLEIDHDDSHCFGNKSFALLVHGSQRAGSAASKAISLRKKIGGFTGYNINKRKSKESVKM
jgi:hypothetical protein